MKTVHEVCELTGLTPRTLHHYDAIGLLRPTAVTEAGYRLYGDGELARLQTIMLFRELEFPLKDIKTILNTPNFDQQEALGQQIKLLELRAAHLNRLIRFAKDLQQGGKSMNFQAFDHKEMEEYAQEVKERWGGTAAYAESREKLKGKSREEVNAMGEAMMDIFARMGALRGRGEAPESTAAQGLVKELQAFISDHYYTCTDEILAGLGEMYVADERMKGNIDKAGGEGTAVFAAQAIRRYAAR